MSRSYWIVLQIITQIWSLLSYLYCSHFTLSCCQLSLDHCAAFSLVSWMPHSAAHYMSPIIFLKRLLTANTTVHHVI